MCNFPTSTCKNLLVPFSHRSQFIFIYVILVKFDPFNNFHFREIRILRMIFLVTNFSIVLTFSCFLLAEGTGNDDISLQCPGTLKVIRVRAFGIPGDNETVAHFDKHCQANLGQIDGTNVCIVSLKRVYKTSYPPFIKTLVTFTCSYTEYVS